MAQADFAQVLQDLDALESEMEPLRLAVDEGEESLLESRTARDAAFRHFETAMRHALSAARGIIEEADWEEPESEIDAIEILVEEDVIPRRIGDTLIEQAELATEEGGEEALEEDLYDRVSAGADALGEYLEYMHLFLKEWSE